MDILRTDTKQLQTGCFTEVQTDSFQIHDTTDQDYPSLKDLTQHLNEGILISSEIASDEESHFDVSDEDADGLLLVWGCGEFGQHGHGHQNDVTITAGSMNHLILGQDGLLSLVDCGSSHTIVVTDDNRIFSWGNCNSGQLGIGDTKTTLQPHVVQLGIKPGTRIRGVACGTRHTFIWTEEGDCFSFGNNFSAQLGYDFRKPDFKENQVLPVYLETLFNQKIHQVSCGSRHSLFLFTSGSVASVGSNDRGQLGHSERTDSVCIQKVTDVHNVTIVGCGSCHSLAADRNGNVYVWGYSKACGSKEDVLFPARVYVANNSSVTGLVGGDSHSLLLLNNGKLLSLGNNFEGQLGLGSSVKFSSKPTEIKTGLAEENVVSISVGENTSAAVTESGRLFMWGKNVSQIIREDEGPRYCQFEPHRVALGKWKATKVACGAWHVACIVSPDARANTWDWTPLRVDIPVATDNTFEQQLQGSDDDASSVNENNSTVIDETPKINQDVFDENNEYTENESTIAEINKELISTLDSANLIENTTSASNRYIEKDCYTEKNTECTVQDEMAKISTPCDIEKEIRIEKDISKDNTLEETITEQRQSQKESLAEDVVNKKRSQSDSLYTKHKTQPKINNRLRRASSEESVKQPRKPLHISTSLCNIVQEKCKDEEEVNPERRRSTGTIMSTSRTNSRSALNRTSGNKIKSMESLSSGSISMHADDEQSSSSTLKPRTSTGDMYGSPAASDLGFSSNPPSSKPPKGGRKAQLNREKKSPRHIRRIPSVPKMEYYLPNQPILSPGTSEDFSKHKDIQKSTINRTQSSPNIVTYHQSDIHAITLSMPLASPSTGIHVPHPPPATDSLPPRHPRFRRKAGAEKIVFSSGSSWRKRNSKI